MHVLQTSPGKYIHEQTRLVDHNLSAINTVVVLESSCASVTHSLSTPVPRQKKTVMCAYVGVQCGWRNTYTKILPY